MLNFPQEPEHILYLKLVVGPFENQQTISAQIYVEWELGKSAKILI